MRANGETASWTGGMNIPALTPKGPKVFMPASVDAAPFQHWEFDDLKQKNQALREENFKLQAVITDVTEVNKRWQRYNNDRQLYVQRLLNVIQEQQEQMNNLFQDRVVISKEMCDKAGVGAGAGVGASGDGPTPLSLEALLQERSHLRDTVSKLGRQLQKTRDEHTQHVELLQYQLKSHQNDWEAERSEKFQALSAKDAAERRVRELQRDLRILKQKFREEKLQTFTHCKCCEAHVSEVDQCNIFLPGSQVNMCRRNHAKTYRTSVHVPCTSSPLLPRGTTIFFSDDLVVDGENNEGAKVSELPEVSKLSDDLDEKLCLQNQDQLKELALLKDTEDTGLVASSSELKQFDGNNNSSKSALLQEFPASEDSSNSFNIVEKDMMKDSWKVPERKNSTVQLNIEHDNCESKSQPSRTITPSSSISSINAIPSNIVAEDDGLTPNGVTIGFDNSGLASVMGFSRVPISKSSSLPEKKELRKEGVNPLISRWSFDSYYTALPIARPPSSHNFGTSMDSLIKGSNFQKPSSSALKDTVLPSSTQKPRAQKIKYSEEGVATQTEDDVICPGCGQIFPPKMHLKFLDHFEICQSNGDQNKAKH